MFNYTNQQYLKEDQYKDASNLNARIAIHKYYSVNRQGFHNWIFDAVLKLPVRAKILELGCGPADMWVEAKDRIPAMWDITLSDLSSGMLDSAWRNLVVTGRSYQFKELDAQSIPFADETFDGVVANFMLYHVPDRPKAFAEIKRVLKPGGRFIAATVGDHHMREIIEVLQQVDVNHEQYHNPFTLENGLEQIRPFFPSVIVSHYDDSLKVTEIEPIIAYIRSSIRHADVSKESLEKARADFENVIDTKGYFFITKSVGLFEAIK